MENKEINRLKAYRGLRSVTQDVMADLIGTSRSTYSLKENGRQSFTLNEAKQIADYFGVTIDEIFFRDTVNF